MSRRLPLLAAALAALLPAGSAAAQDAPHRHQGFVFQVRTAPELNRDFLYKVYRSDPADPASLLVERGQGYSGTTRTVDLNVADCPALGRALAALARLPMPAIAFEEERTSLRTPRGTEYVFQGFVRFPNGGEGEVSFWAYDVPGRTPDAQLVWMRDFVRAFDSCRPRDSR